MNVTVDTNVLIRGLVRDDKLQAKAADKLLLGASLIAVTLPCLCEFVWVAGQVYGLLRADIVEVMEAFLETENMVLNRPAVEAGLALLKTGSDFADGVIAYEGRHLGCDVFVSFDKKAVAQTKAQGFSARLLA